MRRSNTEGKQLNTTDEGGILEGYNFNTVLVAKKKKSEEGCGEPKNQDDPRDGQGGWQKNCARQQKFDRRTNPETLLAMTTALQCVLRKGLRMRGLNASGQ